MRLELTRVGLLVELANHYTTRGAFKIGPYAKLEEVQQISKHASKDDGNKKKLRAEFYLE